MAELKKITISLPNNLLKEIDMLAKSKHIDRSEFVKQVIKLYIKQKRIDKMAKGYQEMAKINLQICEEWQKNDYETQKEYEDKLVECE